VRCSVPYTAMVRITRACARLVVLGFCEEAVMLTHRAEPLFAAHCGFRCDTSTIPAVGKLAQRARVQLGARPVLSARLAWSHHMNGNVGRVLFVCLFDHRSVCLFDHRSVCLFDHRSGCLDRFGRLYGWLGRQHRFTRPCTTQWWSWRGVGVGGWMDGWVGGGVIEASGDLGG
jgi:hypothetical protein